MKTILKIVLAGIILIVLFAGGCAVLVGSAFDSAEKESQKGAITHEQYKNVKKGTTIKQMKKEFGKPSDEQNTEVDGLKMDCIYYPVKGGEMLDSYQFCFDNGKLSSKSKY